MNDTLKTINNRVSLRGYDKKDISKEDLDAILEAAMRAPTAGNQMLYSIIVVKDGKTNTSKVVKKGTKGAKKAQLQYEVLDVFETDSGILSYVLIELITGRHHQIRVQMASRGCGIYGDTKYNPQFSKTKKQYQQIALFATRLEFEHPSTGEHMVFKCEPEGDAFEVIELDEF